MSTSAVIIGRAIAFAAVGGYRLNLTPSEPLGLWRIEPLHRPVELGDLVFICPPVTQVFEDARRRGYLRRGLCDGGFAPLIKTVAALSGQYVIITDHVAINGRPIQASAVRDMDGEGRPLTPDSGGFVPPHHFWVEINRGRQDFGYTALATGFRAGRHPRLKHLSRGTADPTLSADRLHKVRGIAG